MGAAKYHEEKVSKERADNPTRPGPRQPNLPPRSKNFIRYDIHLPICCYYESINDQSIYNE